MNRLRKIVFLVLFIACMQFVAVASDEYVKNLAISLDRLVRITEKPHKMDDSTASLCTVYNSQPHRVHDGFAKPSYCDVYVSSDAEKAIRTGNAEYPAGALIVKTKFHEGKERSPELFTVMRKMEFGYDDENGNWEYTVIDGKSRRVQARGRIDSCIQCHAEYKSTGYFTRDYLREEPQ